MPEQSSTFPEHTHAVFEIGSRHIPIGPEPRHTHSYSWSEHVWRDGQLRRHQPIESPAGAALAAYEIAISPRHLSRAGRKMLLRCLEIRLRRSSSTPLL